jgi:rSAM/selenodomain-associated transferase 1
MDLLVLAKAPVPGRVKTRLCPPCTPAEAAAVAGAALADTLFAASTCGADRLVVALDGEPGGWLPPGAVVVRQGGGSLADRLATAWSAARGPTVQIGMDTPQVGSEELASALGELDRHPAVLGLASDGGWWAIGMRTPRSDVFAGIPTSVGETGALQRSRLRELGLEPALLDERRDVDTWDDAREVARLAPTTRFAAAVGAIDGVRA